MESKQSFADTPYALLVAQYVAEYVPGFALLVALGLAVRAMAAHHPGVSYVLLALLAGFFWRNTIGVGEWLEPGTRLYEVFLKTGMICLGTTLSAETYRRLGATGVVVAAAVVFTGVVLMPRLLEALGVPAPVNRLMGIGFGIGTSAMLGLARQEEARDVETSYTLSVMLLFGMLANLVFPFVGASLGLSDACYGFWTSLTIHNTGEAISASLLYSPTSVYSCALGRAFRNSLLGVSMLYFAGRSARTRGAAGLAGKAHFIWEKFPKFVLGFFLFSLLASLGWFRQSGLSSIRNLGQWALLLTFVGVGLRTSLGALRHSGVRLLAVGFGVQALLAALVLLLLLGSTHGAGFTEGHSQGGENR